MATAEIAPADIAPAEELVVDEGRELTADDLLADRWKGYELVDGEPREKHTGAESEEIAVEIAHCFRAYLKGKGLGRIGSSNTGYACFPDGHRKLRKPDASFVKLDRLPEGRFPKGHCAVHPDIAVEVISPTEESEETMQKVQDFLSAGTTLVWVVYPETRVAVVFRGDGSSNCIDEQGVLSGEDALPGFEVRLADVLNPEV